MAALPADPLGADTPFFAPHRARIDPVAQDDRIEAEALGQVVDRLFEAESTRRIARRPHRAARPRIDEHVVLCALEIWAGIERLGDIADASADRDAGSAVAYERDRGKRAVALGADAQTLRCAGAIARIHLLFFAIEDDAHGRGSFARQGDGDPPVIAERRFRPEAAAHSIDDNAHAVERQAEFLRQFMPHAGSELRRHVNGEPVGAPIGDDRVRLEAAMRLDLGFVFAFDNDIGRGETLCRIAAPLDRGAAHIAVERESGRRRKARGMAGRRGIGVGVEDERRVGGARRIHVGGEGQRLQIETDEPQRLRRDGRRNRGNRGNRRADIAQGAARLRHGNHRAHAGIGRGSGNIDRTQRRVRQRRAQNPAVQHARQRDVDREASRARHLFPAVLTRHRFSDHRERGIGRERRRLVKGDLPRHFAQADAHDAGRKRFGAELLVGHPQPLAALAAASVAATTCG